MFLLVSGHAHSGRNKHKESEGAMDFQKQFCFLIFIVIESNFGIETDNVVYINSANASCDTDMGTCVTLSQFAANDSWLRHNMTVILLPPAAANHTLDLTMSISNITSFSMLSNNKSKIFVICQDSGSLDFTDVNQVWINKLVVSWLWT